MAGEVHTPIQFELVHMPHRKRLDLAILGKCRSSKLYIL